MRIALVNLRAPDDEWPQIVMVPLGAMYLSSSLKQRFGDRVDVRLWDMTLDGSVSRMLDWLTRMQPDVVGIRAFTSHQTLVPVVARLAKQASPRCLVIAGGPYASTLSKKLFGKEAIDVVVPGEGEEVLCDIVQARMEGGDVHQVPGAWWGERGEPRSAGQRPLIGDLDSIPFPDYGILDLDLYQGKAAMTSLPPKDRFVSLFTSRGCHYRCSYCHDNFGKRVRYRSPRNVIEEMEWLVEQHGVREFHIVDDIFNADKERAIDIFDRIVRKGWNVWIAFPNGLRGDIMDEEFISAARAAGAYFWAIAVESATPRIQKLVRKFNHLDRVWEAIELSDKHGVCVETFNMLGFPTETEAEMRATVDFNLESKAHMTQFFLAMPFEGTGLRDLVADQGHRIDEMGDLHYQSFAGDETDWFTSVPREEISQMMMDAHRRFYFDGRRLKRMARLAERAPDHVQFAVLLATRLYMTGTDPAALDDPSVVALLKELFRRAFEEDPDIASRLEFDDAPFVERLAAAMG